MRKIFAIVISIIYLFFLDLNSVYAIGYKATLSGDSEDFYIFRWEELNLIRKTSEIESNIILPLKFENLTIDNPCFTFSIGLKEDILSIENVRDFNASIFLNTKLPDLEEDITKISIPSSSESNSSLNISKIKHRDGEYIIYELCLNQTTTNQILELWRKRDDKLNEINSFLKISFVIEPSIKRNRLSGLLSSEDEITFRFSCGGHLCDKIGFFQRMITLPSSNIKIITTKPESWRLNTSISNKHKIGIYLAGDKNTREFYIAYRDLEKQNVIIPFLWALFGSVIGGIIGIIFNICYRQRTKKQDQAYLKNLVDKIIKKRKQKGKS